MLVEQSEEGGGLQQQDARLLEGVFEVSEKTAQEVMTPRTQMAALEADRTVEGAGDPGGARGLRWSRPSRAKRRPTRWRFTADPATRRIPSRWTISSVWCTPRTSS